METVAQARAEAAALVERGLRRCCVDDLCEARSLLRLARWREGQRLVESAAPRHRERCPARAARRRLLRRRASARAFSQGVTRAFGPVRPPGGDVTEGLAAAPAAGRQGAPSQASAKEQYSNSADWQVQPGTMFGVNCAHMYGEPKYGTAVNVFEDFNALGVQVVRQPGEHDLFTKQLLGGVLAMPLFSELKRGSTYWDEARKSLMPLLRLCAEHEVQVVLTMMSLGGGQASTVSSFAAGVWYGLQSPSWAAHEGETIDGVGYDVNSELRAAIDTESEYQRKWFNGYATFVAELLLDIETELRLSYTGVELDDLIYGIEVVNEIVGSNVIMSPLGSRFDDAAAARSGKAWGWFCYSYGKTLWKAIGRRVPILLPGLPSHEILSDSVGSDDELRPKTWAWLRVWLLSFASEWQRRWESAEGLMPVTTMSPSIDLHWYHRNQIATAQSVGPLHIARLVAVCDLPRGYFDDVGMFGVDITVFESGASVLTTNGDQTTNRPTATTPTLFQASEVWRRISGALCSQALVAGWHSWMSLDAAAGEPFNGMGLRDESGPDAADSAPRYAWYAYQRLTSQLQGWWAVRMALPSAVNIDSSSDRTKDGVVVEFLLPWGASGVFQFGYLCYVDPWRVTGTLVFEGKPASGPVNVTEVQTTPGWTSAHATMDLPEGVSGYNPNVVRATSAVSVSLNSSSPPRLYFTNSQFAWKAS